MRKWLPILVLAVLVLAALACGSDADTDADAAGDTAADAEETVAEEPSEAADVTEEEAEPAEEAEPVEEPEETEEPEVTAVQIIPLEVLDNAEPGMFADVPAGSRLVGVRLAVENGSGEALTINPLNFTLRDQEGLVYDAELAASDQYAQLATLILQSNERIEGWVFYILEEGVEPTAIKMTANIFSSEGVTAELSDLQTPTWEPIAEAPEVGLGEPVSDRGVELTALSVVDPATPGILYTPVEGMRLVAIETQIRNVDAAEPISVNPLYVYLVDDLGFVYEAELGATEEEQIGTRELATSEAMKGFVAFELPDGRNPLYIRYAPDLFDENEYLEVGLVP